MGVLGSLAREVVIPLEGFILMFVIVRCVLFGMSVCLRFLTGRGIRGVVRGCFRVVV